MNCTIVVEQKDSFLNKISTDIYTFDDYRIAVAIENLLANMEVVQKDISERPMYQKG